MKLELFGLGVHLKFYKSGYRGRVNKKGVFEIVTAYYRYEKYKCCSEFASHPRSNSIGGLCELLDNMREACNKPVLEDE